MVVAETDRLLLKKFSENDVDGFFELNNDPEVLIYTGDKPFQNKEEVARFISEYNQYEICGFGRWSIYLKGTGQYIGFSGLRYLPDNEETDIGFRIARKYWGNGYATESAIAGLKIAFLELELKKIIARAMKDNLASHAVIKKLGMQCHSEFKEGGKNWMKYELYRTHWLFF